MDLKKKCIHFKKQAKEFGYDLKLTHVQELIAKYEGYENRHALLSSLKEGKKTKKETKKQEWYYFEIHVFHGRDEGYSIGFRSKESFKIGGDIDEDSILKEVERFELLQYKSEIREVDYIQDISEEEWKWFSNYNDSKIECYSCKQLYDSSEIQGTDSSRREVTCKTCYKNEIKINVSTDDGEYDYVETFISEEYMQWALKEKSGFIEELLNKNYGPDYHTDNLLYDTNSPTLKRISDYLSSYNSTRNKNEVIGYSIYVDEDSFQKWVKINKINLMKNGYDLD